MKKLISLFIACMMLLTVLPAAAFAGVEKTTVPAEKAAEPVKDPVVSWDFETNPLENGWTFSDNDGDGNNWNWSTETAHSTSHSIMSASYASTALTPDNWAITPEFTVPDIAELTYWVKNYSSSYPEKYSVYVVTDAGSTPLIELEQLSGSDWVQKTLDISEFAGQTVSIAFRHHGVTNKWKMYIDDVAVEEVSNVIDTIAIKSFVEPFYGEPADVNVTVPNDAKYSVIDCVWRWSYQGNSGIMQEGDCFDNEDYTYNMRIKVLPNDGYVFADEVTITINGSTDYINDYAFNDGTGYYLINTIDFTVDPNAEPPMNELDRALNAPGGRLHFENNTVYPWAVVDNRDTDNFYARSSNGGVSNSEYGITTTVTVNAGDALTFDFWSRGEGADTNDWDGLRVYVDGEKVLQYGAHTDWEYGYYVFEEAGDYEIAFTYKKDSSVNPTGDYAAVDNVAIESDFQPPVDTTIHMVRLQKFFEPSYNQEPLYEVEVEEDQEHYTLEEQVWCWWDHGDNDGVMGEGDLFDDPELYYYMGFRLSPEEGYEFEEPSQYGPQKNLAILINGDSYYVDYAEVNEDGDLIIWTIDFQVNPNEINLIEIENFVVPEYGAAPDYGVTVPEDAHYSIVEAIWYRITDDDVIEMAEDELFDDPDVTYGLFMYVVPDEDYWFDPYIDVGVRRLNTLINGSTEYVGNVNMDYGGNVSVYTIEFSVTEPIEIDTIEINGFVVPEYGEAPFYGVTVPDGAPYSIVYTDWNWWSDVISDGDIMGEGEVFDDPSSVYYQYFQIVPAEGYVFADNVTVLINGSEDPVDNHYMNDNMGYYEVYTIDYEVEIPIQYIDTIEINDFVVPEYGANPFYGVTVPDGAGYAMIQRVWYKFNTSTPLNPDDTFNDPDDEYYMYFFFVPVQGYAFAEEVTVLINGSDELVYYVAPNNGGISVYTTYFTVEPPVQLIEEVFVNDLAIPRWGMNPDYDVTVPENAHYSISEVVWTKYTEDDGDVTMDPDDVFNDLHAEYYVIFLIIPDEGYDFAEDCVSYINGTEDLVDFGFGYEGEYYIASVDFSVFQRGDVDLNGTVEIVDALLGMRYVLGLIDLNEEQLWQLDVSDDFEYDLIDCVLIMRYAMGLITEYPVFPV